MRTIKLLINLVLAALFLLLCFAFVEHNKSVVSLDLLLVQFEAKPLSLWLVVFFLTGALSGLVASSLLLLRERAARSRVEKKLRTTSKLLTG